MKVQAAAIAAFIAGATLAGMTHTPLARPFECGDISHVITIVPTAVPTDVDTIVWMMKQNPRLSEHSAFQIYETVTRTIRKYHGDARYHAGATAQITARMAVAIIARESTFDPKTRGSLGEIGLMQIYPKYHIKDLTRQGIIREQNDLWNTETNINAGIHILMGYARTAASVEQALAIYNAGPNRWTAGKTYARAVMRLARAIDNNNPN